MVGQGKGLLCPRCDRYTFFRMDGETANYKCSRCEFEGPKPMKKKGVKKNNSGKAAVPISDLHADPSKLYVCGNEEVIQRVDVELQEKYRLYLLSIMSLSEYESRVMSALMATDSPLSARNLMFLTSVPRTKVYNTLRALHESGLVNMGIVDVDRTKLPEIYEFWPEHKQRSFLRTFKISLHVFTPIREAIEEAYKRKRDAFNSIKVQAQDIAKYKYSKFMESAEK